MFREAVIRLHRAFLDNALERVITLPPLAAFVTLTGGAANTMGAFAQIDDGTGTAATGAYDGEAWISGIILANPDTLTQYYDVEINIVGVGVVAIVSIFAETTVVADTHEVYMFPKPIHIGVAPAELQCACAGTAIGGTIDVKLIIEQGY